MARFDYRKLKPDKQRELLDQLADMIASITKKEDARFFLQRLLTPSEIVMLTRRMQAAEMLISGLTYEQVQKKLGVGMSTIYSIDRWLTDAAHEYRLIREHKRAEVQAAAQQRKRAQTRRLESTVPGTIRHIVHHDSRLILVRLLLGDL